MKICRCGHKKGLHEDGYDYGRNGYLCTAFRCDCQFFVELKNQ